MAVEKPEVFSREAIEAVSRKNPLYKHIIDEMLAQGSIRIEEPKSSKTAGK